MLGEVFITDENAGDAEHRQEGRELALPTCVQPAVGTQPSDGTLDLVPGPPQPLGGLDTGASDAHTDTAFAQPVAPLSGVVGLVTVELGRGAPAGSAARAHRGDTPY